MRIEKAMPRNCFLFVVIIIIFTFILMAALVSCEKIGIEESIESTDEDFSGTSSDDIVSVAESEESVDDNSSEDEKTPPQMMSAGDVYIIKSDSIAFESAVLPLAEWFCKNIEQYYGIYKNIDSFVGFSEFNDFEKFTLYYLCYEVNLSYNHYDIKNNISVVCGVMNDSPDKYILIDGHIDYYFYYSLEDNWEKVKQHSVFGKFAGDYPKKVDSDEITELDIASLIGKDRKIYSNTAISDTVVAVISGYPLKVDFIDIVNKSLIYDSHILTDAQEKGYSLSSYTGSWYQPEDYFIVRFYARKSDNDGGYYLYYKIIFNDDGSISDILITDSDSYDYYGSNSTYSKEYSMHSQSGRYGVFRRNYDLYLYDNVANKEILIYDAKPDDDGNYDIDEYHGARPAFFIGEVLYYNIYGWEWCIGSASYNPKTKKTVRYINSVSIHRRIDDYIYGYLSIEDYCGNFVRYNINSPQDIEFLIKYGENLDSSEVLFTPDNKHIIKISSCNYVDEIKFKDSSSTVTVYDGLSFEPIETYTLSNDSFLLYRAIFVGDYIYIPAADNNKAYIIKIK
ncbi:MAG: hypothetical protein CVU97_01230 [Firmicutes bacterium HGW-Firmicutes-21]|nr:MAG: hypothetical protein CVU97_01230 [Firmicutes bacterium HGW-Firmicutes-21]